MKVLFVGTEINSLPNKIGGIESTLRELINYLLSQSVEVELIIFDQSEEKRETIELPKGTFVVIRSNRKNLFGNVFISGCNCIVFLQTPFENPYYTFKFFIWKKRRAISCVKMFFTYPPLKGNLFLQRLKMFFLIDKSIVFSNRIYNSLPLFKCQKYLLTPPVSENFVCETKEVIMKSRILFIGRLAREKGIEKVTDTFRELDSNRYNLYISGYYKDEDTANYYNPIINRIEYCNINVVPNNRKNIIYDTPDLSQYDILFLPYESLYSTLDLPLLILEGLVAKCKIVTTEVGAGSFSNPNMFTITRGMNTAEIVRLVDTVSNTEFVEFDYEKLLTRSVGQKFLSILSGKENYAR